MLPAQRKKRDQLVRRTSMPGALGVHEAREVRRDARMAAGALREEVYAAELRYREPVLADQARQQEYGQFVRMLAGYAEWAARRGLDGF